MKSANSNTFLKFFNSYSGVMLLFDPDSGQAVHANKSALDYYGYSLETITNMSVYEINTLSKEQVHLEMQNALRKKRNNFNFKHRLANGEIRDVEVYASPVELDGKILLLSNIYDITNRNKQIASLQNELDSTLAAIPDSLFEIGIDGKYYNIRTNRTDFLPLPIKDMLGKTVLDILPQDAANVCLEALQEANEQGYSEGKQFSLLIKNSQKWRELSVVKKMDTPPDNPRFIALSRDITIRKEAEKELKLVNLQLKELNESLENRIENALVNLKQKDALMIAQSRSAAMGDTISMIAHQWRQPLSSIATNCNNIIVDIELDLFEQKQSKENLHKISNEIQHLSKTIDDFRDFFKPSKEKEKVPIGQVVNDSLKVMQNSLDTHQINYTIDCKKDCEVLIYSRELLQVLLNIIKNAQEALIESKETDKKIIIEIVQDKKNIFINISNNGSKIKKEYLSKIFDPYFSTKGDFNGTGLGLYMSKIIIQKHMKGNLYAKNTDFGVTFNIKVPKIP